MISAVSQHSSGALEWVRVRLSAHPILFRQSQRTTSLRQGEGAWSVNPLGRWSGFESGQVLTSCRQSQRKAPQVQGEGDGSRAVNPLVGRYGSKGRYQGPQDFSLPFRVTASGSPA
eukprot:3917307-Prymnesium_polylepis.1